MNLSHILLSALFVINSIIAGEPYARHILNRVQPPPPAPKKNLWTTTQALKSYYRENFSDWFEPITGRETMARRSSRLVKSIWVAFIHNIVIRSLKIYDLIIIIEKRNCIKSWLCQKWTPRRLPNWIWMIGQKFCNIFRDPLEQQGILQVGYTFFNRHFNHIQSKSISLRPKCK